MVFISTSLQFFLLCTAVWQCAAAERTVAVTEDPSPYMLIATPRTIFRMDLNGTNIKTLITDKTMIETVDYHYRRNLMFWITSFPPDIKYAALDGSGPVTVLPFRIYFATALTVDWINDKVYWTDKILGAIFVYDINTMEMTKVGNIPAGYPADIKIFPQLQRSSMLYFSVGNGTHRMLSDGSKEEKIMELQCPQSITLDLKQRNLYWFDRCTYQIGTSKMDGSENKVFEGIGNQMFPYGSAMIDDQICWVVRMGAALVYCSDNSSTVVPTVVYRRRNTVFRDIQIVHPSNQPSVEELRELDLCGEICIHGNCNDTLRECTCEEGWTGFACSIDINECADVNGGCQQTCVNTPGSFYCQCGEGMVLTSDKKTCATASSIPSVPSTIAPRSSIAPPTNPQRTTTTSSPPLSAQPGIVSTAPPTTSPAAPSSTTPFTQPSASPSLSSTPFTQPSASPSSSSTPFTQPSASPSSSSTPFTQPSASPSSSSTQPQTESLSLSTDQQNFTSQEIATSNSPPLNHVTREDGLQANDLTTTPSILTIVLTAIVLISLVAISMYVMFLCYKCKQRKKGSYDVYLRQQQQEQPRHNFSIESGTSSTHSSFRDITERYQREIAMSAGSAELGMRGQQDRYLRCASEASSSCGLILDTVPQS